MKKILGDEEMEKTNSISDDVRAEGATHVGKSEGKRKCAFSLAEGATHVEKSEGKRKCAFSLAEALIVIGVIGVVAALTIPTLLSEVNDRINTSRKAAFVKKLSQSTDLLNVNNGIGPYYHSNESGNATTNFLKRLAHHMKISTICDGSATPLTNCLRYEENEGIELADGTIYKLSDITSGNSFGLNTRNYADVAGMILTDGATMILSWNQNCPVSDPYSIKYGSADWKNPESRSDSTSCIKGIYDLNGPTKPNRIGADVFEFNGAVLGPHVEFSCTEYDLGGQKVCLNTTVYDPIAGIDCRPLSASYAGAKYCKFNYQPSDLNNDMFAASKKYCMDRGADLPDMATIQKLFDNAGEIWGISHTPDCLISNEETSSTGVRILCRQGTRCAGERNGKWGPNHGAAGANVRAVCVGQ